MRAPAPRPTRRRAALPATRTRAGRGATTSASWVAWRSDRLRVIGLDQLLREGIEQEAGGLCPAVGERLAQTGNRLHDAAVVPPVARVDREHDPCGVRGHDRLNQGRNRARTSAVCACGRALARLAAPLRPPARVPGRRPTAASGAGPPTKRARRPRGGPMSAPRTGPGQASRRSRPGRPPPLARPPPRAAPGSPRAAPRPAPAPCRPRERRAGPHTRRAPRPSRSTPLAAAS